MVAIVWTDPQVQAAAISGLCTVIATTVAALCASIIGQLVTGRRRLEEQRDRALSDIDFLLEVESLHCALHLENCGESNKIRVRSIAREKGFVWSGRNVPSRRKPS